MLRDLLSKTSGGMQNAECRIQNPESRIQNEKSLFFSTYIMSGKLTTIFVGWVQRSETQHQPLFLFGCVTSTQPTYHDVFIMGNQLDMILHAFLSSRLIYALYH